MVIGAPTSGAGTDQDVDDAGRARRPRIRISPSTKRRARGHLGRLDHRGAAGGERERQFLADDEEGEIPRRDDRDDADRFAQHDAQRAVAEIVVALAVQVAGERGGIAPDIDGAADFAARLGDRLAGLDRVEIGKFFQPRRRSGRQP